MGGWSLAGLAMLAKFEDNESVVDRTWLFSDLLICRIFVTSLRWDEQLRAGWRLPKAVHACYCDDDSSLIKLTLLARQG